MSQTSSRSWLPANPRERRILAVAILLLLVAIVIAVVAVPAVLLHRHYDQHLARMTRQLKAQTAFNAQRPDMIRSLDALKAKDVRKLFLKGTTAALASAELQDQVKQVVESAGGRQNVATASPNKDDGGYRTVSANFQISVSTINLRRLLHALETREPYLFVDNLIVRSGVPFGFRQQPGVPEPELFVQMDVSAIAQVSPDSANAAARPAGGKS
ncbi:MAG: hypothetical protein JNN20_02760 [Betaproteobacteria bacterium]|nr:hypothetical protein [Betaproteobacteria bacterium]